MSDFFLTSKKGVNEGNLFELLRFSDETVTIPIAWGSISGVITRLDSVDRWGPASDRSSGVHVAIAGRIALEEREWREAENLPFEGGVACRKILDEWLQRPDSITAWLNGAAAVMIYSKREEKLHLITDRMGIIPAFEADVEELSLCSHADVLAEVTGWDPKVENLDQLTMAEFIATGQSVHPYTYYKAIKHMDPATHYVWDVADRPRLVSKTEYWRPAYLDNQDYTRNESIHLELAEAFKRAVRLRTNGRLGKTGVLLSGGADSRLMLFGHERPSEVECITIDNGPSDELETAKKLAALAGARHHLLFRDFEYYGRNAPETVRISGGMWSVSDGHIPGFSKDIQALGLSTLLSGCYADYMFKGLSFNRERTRFLGSRVPVYRLAPCSYSWYRPHFSLTSKWANEVDARLHARFPDIEVGKFDPDQLLFEDRRIRPLSREADYAFRAGMYRTLPFDWVFGDKGVLDVYGRLTVEDKLNGVVFEKAVASIVGKKGKKIPNNNYYNTPLGASTFSRAIHCSKGKIIQSFKRTFRLERKESGVNQRRVWPVFKYYLAHSEILPEMWADPTPFERELLTDMLGYDPMGFSVREWAHRRVPIFMRILTVRLWMRQRGLV